MTSGKAIKPREKAIISRIGQLFPMKKIPKMLTNENNSATKMQCTGGISCTVLPFGISTAINPFKN